MAYFAVIDPNDDLNVMREQVDDPVSDKAERIVFLFENERLAKERQARNPRMSHFNVKEIPAGELGEWLERLRAELSLTHVWHVCDAGQNQPVTVDSFLLRLRP